MVIVVVLVILVVVHVVALVGASLSEPHTSVTALHTRVCIYTCTLGPTIYQKF